MTKVIRFLYVSVHIIANPRTDAHQITWFKTIYITVGTWILGFMYRRYLHLNHRHNYAQIHAFASGPTKKGNPKAAFAYAWQSSLVDNHIPSERILDLSSVAEPMLIE